jgi:hypothetical protein
VGTAWWWGRLGGDVLVVRTAWWWERLDGGDGLVMGTAWWWGRLGGEDGLVVRTAWWWRRLDDENGLVMRTIYLPTLNWADKEFFLTFLYIASVGQAWQNPSDTNPRVGLRALISPTRSDTNPRVGFELLSETQPYGQATKYRQFEDLQFRNDWWSLTDWETRWIRCVASMNQTLIQSSRAFSYDVSDMY